VATTFVIPQNGREVARDDKRTRDLAEAYLELTRAHERLHDDFAALFKRVKLSHASYNVLRILRGAHPGGLACGTIAERMVNRVPDITRLVDRLERMGWVTRARGQEDRRVVYVHIAPAGEALLSSLDAPVRDMHRKQLGHLSERDLKQLLRLLRSVAGVT
jgi:DNA-binding MarR family transcriptional regulator